MQIRKAAVRYRPDGPQCSKLAGSSAKYYRDAKGFYQREDEKLKDDTIMYEVFHYTQEDDACLGHLSWGLTVMQPVTVCGECNMTRGHFHSNAECAEIYCGVDGHGLLLLMDENGKTWAEQVEPGTVHYIKGNLAHRLVNTGEEILKVAACWPTAAGHDYGRVERQPFAYRIFKSNGSVEIKSREGERQ